MLLKLSHATGQPIYLQIMRQIRHAIETGALQVGDQIPSIRMLAEQLIVSPNTVAKAYAELAHEGVLDLKHGSGAFIASSQEHPRERNSLHKARMRIGELVQELRAWGLGDDEIRRAFESAVLHHSEAIDR